MSRRHDYRVGAQASRFRFVDIECEIMERKIGATVQASGSKRNASVPLSNEERVSLALSSTAKSVAEVARDVALPLDFKAINEILIGLARAGLARRAETLSGALGFAAPTRERTS